MDKPDSKRTAAAVPARLAAKASLLVLACLGFPAEATAAAVLLLPVGSIPLKSVEGRLDPLTFDARSQRLFVSALENQSVEVVDLVKRHRVRELLGISEPQGLLYAPEKNRLLVCSRGDGTCRSFDATTFREGPWVDLGRTADNRRCDPRRTNDLCRLRR